ncbi:MAG: hypothetical protein V2I33_16960 [Kangiellaceae bacterium]|jgi:hypothetical protein|nr:hypothetical protein [Kangiellaceae bacterium]
MAAKPSFASQVIFNENLVLVHMQRTKVVLNKPIYIRQCVLDNSKLVMYELWYNKLLPLVQQHQTANLRLLGGDTDSFFLHLRNANAEQWFLPKLCEMELLDTSNYPKEHRLFTSTRKAKLGCIKDESDNVASTALNFTGEKRRAKGIQKSVVSNINFATKTSRTLSRLSWKNSA